jgi:hypothetical protein
MFRIPTFARAHARGLATAASKKSAAPILVTRKPEDFFDDSAIPTFAFQESLPKLPLPKLDSTLNNPKIGFFHQ